MTSQSLVRPKDRELDEVLQDLTGARLYRNNVFRLTGLPVTASATQIRRRREEAALMARLGTPPATSGELPLDRKPDWDTVDAAFESMRNPVLRLVHELFWLWDAGEDDDHDYAVRRHCAVLEGPSLIEPGRPDVSDDPRAQQWLVAVEAWAKVLDGDQIWERARERAKTIDDPRLSTGTVRRLRDRLPRHLVDVHLVLAAKAAEDVDADATDRHLWVLDESSFDDDLIETAVRDAVRPAEDRVRAACEAADRVAETEPLKAIAAGHTLLEQTGTPLRTIAAMLGADDPITKASHDQVATSVNLCAVAHDNETELGSPAMSLLLRARELATETTTIELIEKNQTVISSGLVRRKVNDLVEKGKVNKAADRLRALRRHTGDEDLRERIDAALENPTSLTAPLKGLPFRGSYFGWGAYLWGRRATPDRGKWVAIHYFTIFFFPVIPMAAYLRDETYIYGKVPLSMAARWWRLVVLVLAVVYSALMAPDGARNLVLLAVVAVFLGWRRYRLNKWAASR
nr:hypothetical protein [Kibdelosporangium sp. MJ126-NF4]CEL18224.1 hypothetical protein [Kibdelosporangium sp. MJ126-NF4]